MKDTDEQEMTGAPSDIEQDAVEEPVESASSVEEAEDVDAAEPQTPDYRGALRSRLKEYDPEGDYDDDDKFYAGLDSYAKGRDEELDRHRTLESNIQKSVEADPYSGRFLCNMLDGMDWVDNMNEVMGPELMDIVNSPEAKQKRAEMLEKMQQEQQRMEQNEQQSQSVYEQWAADKEAKKLESFGDEITAMLDQMRDGVITAETLDKLWKGFNYDSAVADAKATGEIVGRNEKISAQMQGYGSDGVPSLGEYASSRRQSAKRTEQKQRSASVWDR